MNTYELTQEYEQINTLLETLEEMKAAGEDVAEFEADTMRYINELNGNLYEKADGLAKVITNYTDLIDSRKAEAKRLTESAKVFESRVDYLKNRLLKPLMETSGNRKLECKSFTISFRKSSAVEISDEDKLPLRFMKLKEVKSVDKVGLKKWLSEGYETSGASIIERESVQIK